MTRSSLNLSNDNEYAKSFKPTLENPCSTKNVVQKIPRIKSQNFILYEAIDIFSSSQDESVDEILKDENKLSSSNCVSSCSSKDCITLQDSEDKCINEGSLCSIKNNNTVFSNEIVSVNIVPFGSLECDAISKDIFLYEITNRNKMSVQILTYGARFHKIFVPDKNGNTENVILSCDSLEEYIMNDELYLNATIGRTTGIIKNAKFCHGGESFYLSQNFNEQHHLNGGKTGFDKRVWDADVDSNGDVLMTCVSFDGDNGYPGTFLVQAKFSLTKSNELKVTYTARTTFPCPCNISNRIYFNLGGDVKIKQNETSNLYDHILNVNAINYSINKEDGTPYEHLKDVSETEYDLRIPKQLGIAIACHPDKGFDCLYEILSNSSEELKFVSRVIEPLSGRVMEYYTSENYVWFSTCNDFYEPPNISIVPDYDLKFLNLFEFPKREFNEKTQSQENVKTLIYDEESRKSSKTSKNSNIDFSNTYIKETVNNSKILKEEHSELTLHDSNQTLQHFEICEDQKSSNSHISEHLPKRIFQKHSAFYFQPQKFSNAVNHRNRDGIVLKPGQTYNSEIVLKFGIHTGKVLINKGKQSKSKSGCLSSCPCKALRRCCDYCDENCV